MFNSLKSKSLQRIKAEYPNWVGGIVIEQMALNLNFKPSNVSRRLRELKRDGYLEVRYMNGYAEYKYRPSQEREPILIREQEEINILKLACR